MNNNWMRKALSTVCAAVLLAAAVMTLFPSARAEQYSVGDAEISAAVRNLDINWTSGKVNIAYHSGNTILISEKTTGAISGDMRMRWRLDGDTLRIEYQKPGFHLFSLIPHEKELTVTLPQGFTFKEASISSVSADLIIPALSADSLSLKTTSGDIHASVSARIIQGKLTSGDMELHVMNAAEEIGIASTSGDILAEVKETAEFKADSTSGDVHAVIGYAKKAEMKSVSGRVIVEMSGLDGLKVRTTSGDVTAYLPAAPGFTAQLGTTSGHIDYNLPLAKEGKNYVAGDGSGAVEIHTTSGNITVSAKEN